MTRIFIIGNGGSGKTWLAEKLAETTRAPAVHLDRFHWLPDFAAERPRQERDRRVADAASAPAWIMEGIYGSILEQVYARVTTLIWLDLPVKACIANLLQRGQTHGGTDAQFEELLAYTKAYPLRQNLNSFTGHSQLFERFSFQKFRLSTRRDIASMLEKMHAPS